MQPLSLEELLKKRKEEEEAEAKARRALLSCIRRHDGIRRRVHCPACSDVFML